LPNKKPEVKDETNMVARQTQALIKKANMKFYPTINKKN